ncbi:hypothetical protein IWQ60_007397 [Tieghemiomyces parasiticus]|uniref:Tetraspanin n=1 Tax=Tieghemiomyces parasiticus TaxID=78921 RepID=A0A9W8A5T7_9FUNG|nr:hypothetical protein IWQ60_007397 [Tieghemiomyces parasiticus]
MVAYRVETVRVLAIFFNVLLCLSGLGMIGLAVYALAATHITFSGRTWIPVFMMVMGTLVFLISFLGCYGALLEKRYALMAYAGIVTFLVAIQLAVALYAVMHQLTVEIGLDAAWQNAYDRHPKLIRDIQDEYGCCGFKSPTDRAFPKSSPDACLKSELFGHHRSCFTMLQAGYQTEFRAIIVGEFILIAIQAASLLFTTMLYKQVGTPEHRAATDGERQALLEDERVARGLPIEG